ncbi:zf-CCHC domain-containing protein/UBN2 domain-containing protein [Cephalotus follicularis]|uniref:Zf-CCHC domain-containing protein/UBN2 domain-containing protein n=1 Tax=Cephalotus follicularis TaxID=3775 RepID=A0A1Q3BT26_CEPFO|nr:zf-CCHC domain-containing protein/UBN2 domain-containing protein [Cephalotus follicularis]
MKINDKNECVAKTEDEWDDDDFKKLTIDNKALNILLVSFDKAEYNLVRRCTSTHEVWKLLILTHKGTEQVKNAKLSLLNRDYELFKMQPNESIKNLYNHLFDITNALLGLGKVFGKDELVRKLLGCLNDERFQKKNPNKGEGSKMDPRTCFECNKPGHIKVDCPQLKKKNLFKKKALKAWHLSGDQSFDDEVTEQVANLCFMASSDNEESDNEVDDSYTFGELQFAFDELLVEFKKKFSQYSPLKKNMASIENEKDLLVIENEHLKNDISILEHELAKKVDCVVKPTSCDNIDLEKEVESLKKKNVNLEKSFSKFTLGSMKLEEMLAIQRPYLDKTGIGYIPLEVKAKLKNTKTRPYCTYCHKVGHVVDKCFKKIAHYQ